MANQAWVEEYGMRTSTTGVAQSTAAIKVAVMGCVVNGPGEARAADVGIAGGVGEGLLFKKGEIVKKVPQEALVDELFGLIESL